MAAIYSLYVINKSGGLIFSKVGLLALTNEFTGNCRSTQHAARARRT
jgi:hypothetical protein